MNARDHVSDADVLTAVRDSLSGMPLASPRMWKRSWPGAAGLAGAAA